jgi:DNA-binding transcriptional LysR family regulator
MCAAPQTPDAHCLADVLQSLGRNGPGGHHTRRPASYSHESPLLGPSLVPPGWYEADVAVLVHAEQDRRLHLLPLRQQRIAIMVPSRHPLAQRRSVRLRDLDGQPFIHTSSV